MSNASSRLRRATHGFILMAFKPLSSILHAATPDARKGLQQLRVGLAKYDQYRVALRAVLPPALCDEIVSASDRKGALALTVRSHASATKLYQFQQPLLTYFAAKDLNFKEIRVFVQLPSRVLTASARKPVLPAEAARPLREAAQRTSNMELKTALERLASHASGARTAE